jgi:protein translocase SecG subunit
MTQVILAIHLMVVIALIIVILYQKSEGGALGMGGQGGVFTGRGQANALTRATGILATAFFLTSIALTVIPAWQRRVEGGGDWTKAINQGDIKLKEIKPGDKSAPAPEAGKETIFDQLQRAQQQRQQQAPATAPATVPAPAAEAPKVEPTKSEAPRPVEPKAEAPKPVPPSASAPVVQPSAPTVQPAAPAVQQTTPAEPPPVKWTAPTR